MVSDVDIENCNQLAKNIAAGGKITAEDLVKIYNDVEMGSLNPQLIPDNRTVTGKISIRRERINFLVEMLWGEKIDYYQRLENDLIKSFSQSDLDIENKDPEDVVTPKLLCRILASANFVVTSKGDEVSIKGAVDALNAYLFEICTKGNIMKTFIGDQPLYPKLVNAGVILSGDKYLPCPEKLLTTILLILRRGCIRKEAYISQ